MEYLFSRAWLREWLEKRREMAVASVQTISPDRVLAVPVADLVQEIVAIYKADPPKLKLEERYTPGAMDVAIDVSKDPRRFVLDRIRPAYVPGTRIEVRVPFDGNSELFRLRPSRWTTVFPRARVEGQELVISYQAPADSIDPSQVQQELERKLELVQNYLQWVSADCLGFNDQLERDVARAIEQRKQKVLQDRNIEAFLQIPVRRRPDPSTVFSPIPPLRRQTRSSPAAHSSARGTKPFAPEPAISEGDFAEILSVIRDYRDLVERLPGTFSRMSETVLRDILLVVLNNQFGPAGGEVFSGRGKTDIHIWHDKGAVFIAECKFWKGAKAFEEALNQLLGYLVWRDTKAALILFVRQRNVTKIAAEVQQVITNHGRYKRPAPNVAGFPVYTLHHEGDPHREIKVALVVIPVPKSNGATPHN